MRTDTCAVLAGMSDESDEEHDEQLVRASGQQGAASSLRLVCDMRIVT